MTSPPGTPIIRGAIHLIERRGVEFNCLALHKVMADNVCTMYCFSPSLDWGKGVSVQVQLTHVKFF